MDLPSLNPLVGVSMNTILQTPVSPPSSPSIPFAHPSHLPIPTTHPLLTALQTIACELPIAVLSLCVAALALEPPALNQ